MAYGNCYSRVWIAAILLNGWHLQGASFVLIAAFPVNYDQKQDHGHGYACSSGDDNWAGSRTKKRFPVDPEEDHADDQRCQIREEMGLGHISFL
jgi:hypothetical protein